MNRKALGVLGWCVSVACGPELATGTGASGSGGGDDGDSSSADASAGSGGGSGDAATCWEWVPDGPAIIEAIEPLSDGSLVVVGWWDDGPAIAKLDADGALLWSTSQAIAKARYRDVVVLASGDFVVLGMSIVDFGWSRALLHGYTADGVQTWASTGDELDDQWFYEGVHLASPERVVVGGDAGVLVFDAEGSLVETIDSDATFVFSVATRSRGFATCGLDRSRSPAAWAVTAFDDGADPQWSFQDETITGLSGCAIATHEPDRVVMLTGDISEERGIVLRSIVGAELEWTASIGELGQAEGVVIADDGRVYATGFDFDTMWVRAFSPEGHEALLRQREGIATAIAWTPGRLFYAGVILDDTQPAFVSCLDLAD